jgi:hypothetical protein
MPNFKTPVPIPPRLLTSSSCASEGQLSLVRVHILTAACEDDRLLGCSSVSIIALMMEAVRVSVTSVYSNEATRRCVTESCYLQLSLVLCTQLTGL